LVPVVYNVQSSDHITTTDIANTQTFYRLEAIPTSQPTELKY